MIVLRGSVALTVDGRTGRPILVRRLSAASTGAYIPPGFPHSVRCLSARGALLLVLASHRTDGKVLLSP